MSLLSPGPTPRSACSTLTAPSTDLKELLVARARRNPHFCPTYLDSPGSPGSERPSSLLPARPHTPPSSTDSHSIPAFATPNSLPFSEGSQYSPSFVEPDPETRTLRAVAADSPIPGPASADSCSPIMSEARSTPPGPLNLPERSYPPSPNTMLLPRDLSLPHADDLSAYSNLRRSFVGPKVTRHGDAPWLEDSADDCSSGGTAADLARPHHPPSRESSDKPINPTGPFARLSSVTSHVAAARQARRVNRGRSRSAAFMEGFGPLGGFSSTKAPAGQIGVGANQHVSHGSASSASTMGAPRSASGSSNEITEPSTTATTPSSSWSSLVADPSKQHIASQSQVTGQPLSAHINLLHSPGPFMHLAKFGFVGGISRSSSNTHGAQSSGIPSFPSAHDPAVPSRPASPSNLGKLLKTKKSNGFLRTLKKAVGSMTPQQARAVSGPLGDVVRNGGADPMPTARPIPPATSSAPPVPRRTGSVSFGKLKVSRQAPPFVPGCFDAPVPLPSVPVGRRGGEGLRPVLDLRPISINFSAGFADEFLHSTETASPRLPHSAPAADLPSSSWPTPFPTSLRNAEYENQTRFLAASEECGITKEEVSALERQVQSLRDEISALKAERSAFVGSKFYREAPDQGAGASKCEMCGCVGDCSGAKKPRSDQPRV